MHDVESKPSVAMNSDHAMLITKVKLKLKSEKKDKAEKKEKQKLKKEDVIEFILKNKDILKDDRISKLHKGVV